MNPKIRYRVIVEILFGYAMLAPNFFIFATYSEFSEMPAFYGLIFVFMVYNALVFHYLTLYIHAGAHYEISKNKKLNDILSNALIGYPFLISVAAYRRKHFMHHRYFGSENDAEDSYTYEVSLKNFVKHAFFIVPVQKVLGIYFLNKIGSAHLGPKSPRYDFILSFTVFTLIHSVLATFYFSRHAIDLYVTTIIIPMLFLLPVVAWLRTVAEHRAFNYRGKQSVVLRNFKLDFLGFFLGAAGFRDHDLHHMRASTHYHDYPELLRSSESRMPRESYFKVIWVHAFGEISKDGDSA